MGRIDWIPIEEMPQRLHDGRYVLLWARDSEDAHVARYDVPYWITASRFIVQDYTHFAEINPPS